ncbi:MAG: MmcQ/YjbR family DNA-binding protein [Usitatibacteraceae bacterium]
MEVQEFRDAALSFTNTEEVEHFDKRAFRARRIFASLACDQTANLLLTLDEQEFYTSMHPEVLARVPNKWGDRGWTRLSLAESDVDLVRHLLSLAWKGSS